MALIDKCLLHLCCHQSYQICELLVCLFEIQNVSKTRNDTEIKDCRRMYVWGWQTEWENAKEFNVLIDCLCDTIKMRARLKYQIKPITCRYRAYRWLMNKNPLLVARVYNFTMVYTVINTCIAHPQFIGNDGTFIVFAVASIVMMLLCNIILPEARQ